MSSEGCRKAPRPYRADARVAVQVTKVVIPPAKPDKPNREFGFIHFAAKETVDKLILDAEQGTKPELDGKTLEVLSPLCGLPGSCSSCTVSTVHVSARMGSPCGCAGFSQQPSLPSAQWDAIVLAAVRGVGSG